MKIVDGTFDNAPACGRGWSVFVDALSVPARIGIHPHEHGQPQPLVIDAQLGYGRAPKEEGDWIDYESWCARIADFLAHKSHTRLLETLVADVAALSFREWPALETLTLAVHKPKIRPGTRRVGVSLDWTRADYLQWNATAAQMHAHA
ncbi:dihydroneopterin aldolase [Paraburkholderia bannensis]|uniref:Dihydroneopterin aldolase n=1 Tax=Paraburkholderia tropica TaxID=92647 RepID=A0AAQ1GDQ4_9BURK|nr:MULTISPECIES: dihydroneopterin aldolase [Paraburkholderia]QNB14341.1 dihydroneopterin aldolase [Paraburkholderia tropica]RQM50702.1 dihydroneopterin aldolase [Paraburkholderia bannensis]RQN40567.1 dihydroneopterin aldolase [Paraburkholderia tropica]SEJ40600.1 dihydroneopterin aldolase [Paraburkholderia tropica]